MDKSDVQDRRIFRIKGFMAKDDLRWLYARAREVPEGGTVVEIGTLRGRSAAAWYQGLDGRGRLFCIDVWNEQGYYASFVWNMLDLGYMPNILRMSSQEAAQYFVDSSVDIVFLDGDHDNVAHDIELWWPKLKPGGLMVGHDWREGGKLQRDVLIMLPGAMYAQGRLWQCRKRGNEG